MKRIEGKTIRKVTFDEGVLSLEFTDGIVFRATLKESRSLSFVLSDLPVDRQCLDCVWFRPKKSNPCANTYNPFSTEKCMGKGTQEELNKAIETWGKMCKGYDDDISNMEDSTDSWANCDSLILSFDYLRSK